MKNKYTLKNNLKIHVLGLKMTGILLFLTILSPIFGQNSMAVPPALDAIKTAELKSDLFTLASDSMRGRRAGTLDELNAATWVAQRAQEAGLEPAGDNGTYFQFFNLKRQVVDASSTVKINGDSLALWQDAWITAPAKGNIEDSVTWLENLQDTTVSYKDKVIATPLMPPTPLPAEGMSLWVYRYALSAIRQQAGQLIKQGAKAVILVADSTAQSKIGFFGHGMEEGTYAIASTPLRSVNEPPVLLVSPQWAEALQKKDATILIDLNVNQFDYPSANVVAKAVGSDAQLKKEYVLFSGHHDHDGVGESVKGDSIWNGADDNASVSVALLAIGRAWTQKPGKRSALFVWHGAEERGLFGSRYFAENPTVPKENIAAVLNGDMIGRNAEGEAALLGAIAPHRNSQELVAMAMKANAALTKFKVDTSWDAEAHPEHWYFRSDHLPYAQTNIPAIFFTTLLHPDYHTPRDEPETINMDKLTKMTQWIYATGWEISETGKKPTLIAE
ncbi:M28 family peptidase [Flavimarina sp. Hel_I_48]|uniref:M28 family peptidase n=1 Tax=Flavimarina sp. Hel_I_48 TaxID=1392488 RepID=UPI00068ADA69|nr:M28 family peptidase [Flavimarina sp. Hel_I_48]